jgi:proteic killer suppression protein
MWQPPPSKTKPKEAKSGIVRRSQLWLPSQTAGEFDRDFCRVFALMDQLDYSTSCSHFCSHLVRSVDHRKRIRRICRHRHGPAPGSPRACHTNPIDKYKQYVYHLQMIRSFADTETERFFVTGRSRRLPREILRRATMRLQQLDAATRTDDLRLPPSNRLEALKGDRVGQHSIRVNDQWRICFRFSNGDAFDVEIADYH